MTAAGKGLGIEVDFSLPAERVIRALDQIIEWRGQPETLRVTMVRNTSVKCLENGQKNESSNLGQNATH